jgi:hypothetical protein
MIEAFRLAGRVVLQVKSTSNFESALLKSAAHFAIHLRPLAHGLEGVSRYRLSGPDENTFGHHLAVVFRRWPRRKNEHRVRTEIRKMRGDRYSCRTTERHVHLTAPHSEVALVRCGLHAGTFGWPMPECEKG